MVGRELAPPRPHMIRPATALRASEMLGRPIHVSAPALSGKMIAHRPSGKRGLMPAPALDVDIHLVPEEVVDRFNNPGAHEAA